jgi:ABC-type phosphate transport system substrate-binding protein
MKHNLYLRWMGALLSVSAVALSAADAHADPSMTCYDAVARPKVIYVAGSSAAKPFLGVVAQLLAKEATPYTVVYQSQGSCTGVNAIYSGDPSQRLMKDIPAVSGKPSNYAIVFNADGVTSTECSLDPMGNPVDVGISDVFASTCGAVAPVGVEIADYEGPIQPMTFVVPSASTQKSISAEAAYMIFGLGGNNGVAAPWTDPSLYFVRNVSSGTQQMIGRAIGVPAEKWWGGDRGSSNAVRDNMKVLLEAATAEKSIGILSSDIADEERSNLRVLAFQGKGQSCGYWPDATPFAQDKLNVRDGHYPIWGPVHFYTQVKNKLPSEAAGALVSRFAAERLEQVLIDTIIQKHLVPRCAMKVKRTEEMGPLTPYTTDSRCGCYFDYVANGATTCKACKGPGDCPKAQPACNYGYCEAP